MAGLREKNAADTIADIRAAAKQLFEEHGFEKTSMAAVAGLAGISPRTLYNYYPRKEMLYLEDYSFFPPILKAAAAPFSRPFSEAVAIHLQGLTTPYREFEDVNLAAFDRLLWDEFEFELADILIHKTEGQGDSLAKHLEAALIVMMMRSLLWPAFKDAESKGLTDRKAWLGRLVPAIRTALEHV